MPPGKWSKIFSTTFFSCIFRFDIVSVGKAVFNPLTPMSDQDRISPYNIKEKSDENEEKYKLGDYKLIQHQFLQTNITRTVWQTVRRISSEILGVKRLNKTPLPTEFASNVH